MELRCYHFVNYYMSQTQHGIQSAHAQMELFVKYKNKSKKRNLLFNWAENHKTMIVLNGGNNQCMENIWDMIDTDENPFPYAKFNEDQDSLGGLLTNVAIVVPDYIYTENNPDLYNTGFKEDLNNLLTTSSLA